MIERLRLSIVDAMKAQATTLRDSIVESNLPTNRVENGNNFEILLGVEGFIMFLPTLTFQFVMLKLAGICGGPVMLQKRSLRTALYEHSV